MRESLDEFLDAVVNDGDCDVVADIARFYPIDVVCRLLGAPRNDWPRISGWADQIFRLFHANVAQESQAILRAYEELDAYVDAMVDERRGCLTDDLISDLIRAEDEGDCLTREEFRMLVSTILTAGTHSTRHQLAAGVEAFCDHPEQFNRLASEPQLASNAVEEVLRYAPVIISSVRIAKEDADLFGITFPAGTLTGVAVAVANRDPAVFRAPDTFDITRQESESVCTFGRGMHFCLGAHLARAELAVAFAAFPRRTPKLRRNGPCPWVSDSGVSGPITLPIAFEPGH